MSEKNTNAQMLELPMNFVELMMETVKKNTELSINFVKEMEKNQRDFMKASYDLLNVAMPMEGKLWDMQTNVMEKTMDMYEKSYEKVMAMWK